VQNVEWINEKAKLAEEVAKNQKELERYRFMIPRLKAECISLNEELAAYKIAKLKRVNNELNIELDKQIKKQVKKSNKFF
jgi:hypothetical protein